MARYSCLIFLLVPIVAAQAPNHYQTKKQYYDSRVIDPILTPIINWFDLYNQNEPQFVQNIDDNTVTQVPNPVFRAFSLYPATTTASPNFLDNFLRPLIEPFQREFERNNRVRQQVPSPQQQSLSPLALASPTVNHNKQPPISNLLDSIGLSAKQQEEVQIGRDKVINILGMDVGHKNGMMLSPLKGLSFRKQNLFGPVAVNDDYKVNWNFLDNINSMFMPKHR